MGGTFAEYMMGWKDRQQTYKAQRQTFFYTAFAFVAAGTCTFVGRSTVGRILQGVTPSQTLVSPTGTGREGTAPPLTFLIKIALHAA